MKLVNNTLKIIKGAFYLKKPKFERFTIKTRRQPIVKAVTKPKFKKQQCCKTHNLQTTVIFDNRGSPSLYLRKSENYKSHQS